MEKGKKYIRNFYNKWVKLSLLYKEFNKNTHLHFPEPLSKEIVKLYYDRNLEKSDDKTYDFAGKVELKLVTRDRGNSHFSKNQTECQRILYLKINCVNITLYDLSKEAVEKINTKVKGNNLNITLDDFIENDQGKVLLSYYPNK